jgi:HSP20 family molecular chaperone IbpA
MVDQGSIFKDERDLSVDIFENGKKIRIIVELHGVNEEDIRLDLIEDILTVVASRGNQNYYKIVKLPRPFEGIIGKMFNNGILEVTLN